MTALYSVDQIRHIERTALATLQPGTLMRRAGAATAALASSLLATETHGTGILILAGPGNNGGDALEAAATLAQAGLHVTVLMPTAPSTSDANQALQRTNKTTARFLSVNDIDTIAPTDFALVIDGLFGIGLTRPVASTYREIIDKINAADCLVLALDVPSGLNGDTGTVIGPDGVAVNATHTLTFIGDKPGLHTGDGRDYAGSVMVADLNIGNEHFPNPVARLNSIDCFADKLHRRAHNTHKGTYGDVIITGGASGMTGAALLAARAAAQCGAGRVFAAFIDTAPGFDTLHPELMLRSANDIVFGNTTIVIGPGLGNSDHARDMLENALAADAPLVIDADALNLIASDNMLEQALTQRQNTSLITPHPLEAARLLHTNAHLVQLDRLAAARALAKRFRSIVVLKGSGSVIAAPDGSVVVNTTGNPALATAGTGDVLAGVCGALLAQKWNVWEAALGAVWLHGKAADMLVADGVGPIGLTASELIHSIRSALNHLVKTRSRREGAAQE